MIKKTHVSGFVLLMNEGRSAAPVRGETSLKGLNPTIQTLP